MSLNDSARGRNRRRPSDVDPADVDLMDGGMVYTPLSFSGHASSFDADARYGWSSSRQEGLHRRIHLRAGDDLHLALRETSREEKRCPSEDTARSLDVDATQADMETPGDRTLLYSYVRAFRVFGLYHMFSMCLGILVSFMQPTSKAEFGVVRVLLVLDQVLLHGSGFMSFLCFFPHALAASRARKSLRRCSAACRRLTSKS